jgi:DNA-binding winged helix-turn-helix (wHTH) protein
MQDNTSSGTEGGGARIGKRRPWSIALVGSGLIAGLLLIAWVILFINLPDANAFNDRVEQIFIENDALTSPQEVKLLEILAQSGTAFSDVLASYRFIIFVLLVFASALLLSALVFLMTNRGLSQRMSEIERSGIHINSLIVSREERVVYINNMEFDLTESICETLSVLCEARLDDEVITGVELESMITGKDSTDCDEATGATRIKRLRDHLGNQMVSQLLVKNISRKGYMLSIDKDVIRMI